MEVRHLTGEESVFVDRYRRIIRLDDVVLNTDFVIVLTKSRCAVYYSSTCIGSDKITSKDLETAFDSSFLEVREERFVFLSYQLRSLEFLYNSVCFFVLVETTKSRFGKDIVVSCFLVKNFNVVKILIDN